MTEDGTYKSNTFNEAWATSMTPMRELGAGPPEMSSNEWEENDGKKHIATVLYLPPSDPPIHLTTPTAT